VFYGWAKICADVDANIDIVRFINLILIIKISKYIYRKIVKLKISYIYELLI